jgi:hypothetical protein
MCHHVDMDIDWEEAVTEQDTETLTETPEADAEEPELDAEESPPEAAPPADD